MTESEAIDDLKHCVVAYEVQHPNNVTCDLTQEILDIAIEALKKQIPKKPSFTEDKQFALCPSCNGNGLVDKQKYCDNCGQLLDWLEESEE